MSSENQNEASDLVGTAQATPSIQIKIDPLTHYLSFNNNPAFYANGFQVGLTHSECFLIFMQNNAQKVALTLPMSAVKSLRKTLEKVEEDYQRQFGVNVLSIEELATNQEQNVKK